jgi:Fe2+ or Zn2+ uptake regulation protein
MSAADIYNEILKASPNASQSSIYRNIEDMVKKWELKKLDWLGKKAYFETNTWNHIHLVDQSTGEIIDIDIDILKLNIPNIPKNFKTHTLDIKVFWEFE